MMAQRNTLNCRASAINSIKVKDVLSYWHSYRWFRNQESFKLPIYSPPWHEVISNTGPLQVGKPRGWAGWVSWIEVCSIYLHRFIDVPWMENKHTVLYVLYIFFISIYRWTVMMDNWKQKGSRLTGVLGQDAYKLICILNIWYILYIYIHISIYTHIFNTYCTVSTVAVLECQYLVGGIKKCSLFSRDWMYHQRISCVKSSPRKHRWLHMRSNHLFRSSMLSMFISHHT